MGKHAQPGRKTYKSTYLRKSWDVFIATLTRVPSISRFRKIAANSCPDGTGHLLYCINLTHPHLNAAGVPQRHQDTVKHSKSLPKHMVRSIPVHWGSTHTSSVTEWFTLLHKVADMEELICMAKDSPSKSANMLAYSLHFQTTDSYNLFNTST